MKKRRRVEPPSNKSPLFFDDLAPWNDNSNSIWLASTLLLHRNLESYNFPGKLTLEKRKQIVALAGKQIQELKGFDQPILLKSEDSSPLEKELLTEHCLTNIGFLQAQAGEAFFFDRHGRSLLTINIDDHLHFHYIDTKEELEKGWNELSSYETQLRKTLSYSFSQKFGFLTSNPMTCGTGLTISLFLQLTALIHTGRLEQLLQQMKEDPILCSGLLGNPLQFVGDLAVIRNQYTLGVNEESIISSMRTAGSKLIGEERKIRESLKDHESIDLKDKVARAFGLLVHSYQIETVEALNEIALMKFGLELGWIKGITMKELNALFFSCRRAHLLRKESQKIALEELGHKRAEFIHGALKNVALTI